MSLLARAHVQPDLVAGPGPGSSGQQDWPFNINVLVVDDDPLCLKIVEHQLRRCNYQVTTCANGRAALEKLRDKSNHFDLVLSDVYMPDMDGFKLLEHIGLELDLPVIMMSSNGETSVVLRGVTHGAVDFLIKPVRVEELRNVWQHVIRRQGKDKKDQAGVDIKGEGEDDESAADSRHDPKKRKEQRRDSEDGNAAKKPRVVWSVEMHQQFVTAVNQLGVEKAVPKRILDLMSVEGLTRENVASHLQKYRLYLKRLSGVSPGLGRNKSGKFQPDAQFQALMAGNQVFPPAVQYVPPVPTAAVTPGMIAVPEMANMAAMQVLGSAGSGLQSMGSGQAVPAAQLTGMVISGAAPDFVAYGAPPAGAFQAGGQGQGTSQPQVGSFEGRVAVPAMAPQSNNGFPQMGVNQYSMAGEGGLRPGGLDVDLYMSSSREMMQDGSGPLSLQVPRSTNRPPAGGYVDGLPAEVTFAPLGAAPMGDAGMMGLPRQDSSAGVPMGMAAQPALGMPAQPDVKAENFDDMMHILFSNE